LARYRNFFFINKLQYHIPVAENDTVYAIKIYNIGFVTTAEMFIVQLLFYDADAETRSFRVMAFEVNNSIAA
jgi:hypothetical protein